LFDRARVLGRGKAAAAAGGGGRLLRNRALPRPPRTGLGAAPRTRRKESAMLRVYGVMIETMRLMKAVIAAIEARDADLARQLKRAVSSVALNIAEGSGSNGGVRRARYRTALGSAREVGACLDVAEAFGYVASMDVRIRDGIREVQCTLVRVT